MASLPTPSPWGPSPSPWASGRSRPWRRPVTHARPSTRSLVVWEIERRSRAHAWPHTVAGGAAVPAAVLWPQTAAGPEAPRAHQGHGYPTGADNGNVFGDRPFNLTVGGLSGV